MKFALPAAVFLLSSAVAIAPLNAQAPASSSGASRTPTSLQTSPFFGGVPTGTATAEPIPLTILGAITRSLEHNLGLLNAEEGVAHAHGTKWTALADLLPNVGGRVFENRQKVNLAAFGFPLPPGYPGSSVLSTCSMPA